MDGPHNAILSRAPKRPLCSSRRKDESSLHPDPALHTATHTHIQVFKQTKFVLLHFLFLSLLLLTNTNFGSTPLLNSLINEGFNKGFNTDAIEPICVTPKNIVKRTIVVVFFVQRTSESSLRTFFRYKAPFVQ